MLALSCGSICPGGWEPGQFMRFPDMEVPTHPHGWETAADTVSQLRGVHEVSLRLEDSVSCSLAAAGVHETPPWLGHHVSCSLPAAGTPGVPPWLRVWIS